MSVACSDDGASRTPFEPQLAGQGVAQRPFAGSCTTAIQFVGPTSLYITGVCQMRGVGRVDVVLLQELTFAADGSVSFTNTGTYTTPSGDALYATFEGTGVPDATQPVIVFQGTETYVGGTGRFEDASGSSHATGSASLATNTGAYAMSGTLTY